MEHRKSTESDFWAKLDVVGEEQVRINLIKNIYGDHGTKRELVQEWLRRKENELALEASAKHDALEKETLTIAKEAIFLARSASRQVRIYRIISIVAIIFSIFAVHDEFMRLISSLLPGSSN